METLAAPRWDYMRPGTDQLDIMNPSQFRYETLEAWIETHCRLPVPNPRNAKKGRISAADRSALYNWLHGQARLGRIRVERHYGCVDVFTHFPAEMHMVPARGLRFCAFPGCQQCWIRRGNGNAAPGAKAHARIHLENGEGDANSSDESTSTAVVAPTPAPRAAAPAKDPRMFMAEPPRMPMSFGRPSMPLPPDRFEESYPNMHPPQPMPTMAPAPYLGRPPMMMGYPFMMRPMMPMHMPQPPVAMAAIPPPMPPAPVLPTMSDLLEGILAAPAGIQLLVLDSLANILPENSSVVESLRESSPPASDRSSAESTPTIERLPSPAELSGLKTDEDFRRMPMPAGFRKDGLGPTEMRSLELLHQKLASWNSPSDAVDTEFNDDIDVRARTPGSPSSATSDEDDAGLVSMFRWMDLQKKLNRLRNALTKRLPRAREEPLIPALGRLLFYIRQITVQHAARVGTTQAAHALAGAGVHVTVAKSGDEGKTWSDFANVLTVESSKSEAITCRIENRLADPVMVIVFLKSGNPNTGTQCTSFFPRNEQPGGSNQSISSPIRLGPQESVLESQLCSTRTVPVRVTPGSVPERQELVVFYQVCNRDWVQSNQWSKIHLPFNVA